jgi:hypothetical protein
MNPRRRFCRALCAALLAAGALAAPALAEDQPAPPVTGRAPLFRVILNDGTALMSYGEFARVGDRIVFSMPIGSPRGEKFQLVTLPAGVVNWEATNEYAASTRYSQYVATRGEADYAALTGQVAQAISEIGLAKEPARRLEMAERTRRLLAAWPMEHYGYRQGDIEDMLSLLEGTISQLREQAGIQQVDFSLVATAQPPTMPLLPDPSASQAIDQALLAAKFSEVPAERIALLQSAISAIDENSASLSAPWAEATRALARSQLEGEVRTERRYAELARTAVTRADAAASRADVHGVAGAIAAYEAGDKALGQQRKDEAAGLLALLRERLDAARRLRLARDQWARRVVAIRSYRAQADLLIARLAALGPSLTDVKALAGPDALLLPGLARRFDAVSRRLGFIQAPADMGAAHAALLSSADMGAQAMRLRERAVSQNDIDTAWNASSAAAASMLMLKSARQQIEAAARPPERR